MIKIFSPIGIILLLSAISLSTACTPSEKLAQPTLTETPIASEPSTPPAVDETPLVAENPAQDLKSESGPIAFIKKIEKTEKEYRLETEFSVMTQGDAAVNLAIKETKCPKARIFDGDCAPSLNNNFYISKKRTPRTLTATLETKVVLNTPSPDGLVSQETTVEKLFNLFNQTDAYNSDSPFRIEEKDGVATQIEEQYIP